MNITDETIYYMLYFIAALMILLIICVAAMHGKLKKYEKVTLGMSEAEMLKIMGKGYNKSLLKNNRVKYEWRINASSYQTNGLRMYGGVHKVDIYVTNGVVDEVKPYNV